MTLKPSQAAGHQPFLHLVGDHLPACRPSPARHSRPAAAASWRTVRFSRLARAIDPFAAALALVGFGDLGQRAVGIECARIGAERRSKARRWRCRRCTRLSSRARFAFASSTRVADHDEGAGQDLHVVGIAAEPWPPGPSRRHRSAGRLDRPAGGEDHLGGLGGELAAGLGGAGLHDHRPALHRPRDVQRAAHRQILGPCGSAHGAWRDRRRCRSRRRG